MNRRHQVSILVRFRILKGVVYVHNKRLGKHFGASHPGEGANQTIAELGVDSFVLDRIWLSYYLFEALILRLFHRVSHVDF